MQEKLKSFLADDALFMALLLILVGVISFGLGRQSVAETVAIEPNNRAGVMFTETVATPNTNEKIVEDGKVQVVGSRSGTKYHLPVFPGAGQMKEENKVFFDSISMAEAAGYTPAANCPGL